MRIKGLRDVKTLKDIRTLRRRIKCPACNGTGIAKTRLTCPVCGGTRFVRDVI